MYRFNIEFDTEEELKEFRNIVIDNLSIHRGCVPNRLDNGTFLVESKDVIRNALDARLKLHSNKYPKSFLDYIRNKEYVVGTSFETFFLENCEFQVNFHCINNDPNKPMSTLSVSSKAYRRLDKFVVPRGNDDMDPTDYVVLQRELVESKIRASLVRFGSLKTHVNLMELAILHKIKINVIITKLPYESILSRVFGIKNNHLIANQKAIECFIEVI